MLNLIHLQTFRAVLETGSLSAAGKKLGYTTSAVSQQVTALERSLGVQLFERGPSGLWPSPAAAEVAEVAEEILDQLTAHEADIRRAATGRRGRLRLAAFPSVESRLLPSALARLVGEFPEAEFTIRDELESMEAVELVQSRRADLGLVFDYALARADWPAGIDAHHLLDEEIVVLAAAHRPHPLPPRIDLAALAGEVWVSDPEGVAGRTNLSRVCAAAGFEPRVHFVTSHFDAMRGIIREDLAIALVPALGQNVDTTITMHRVHPGPPRRQVYAVHRAADPNPLIGAAVRALTQSVDEFIVWTTTGFVTDSIHEPLAARPTAPRRSGRDGPPSRTPASRVAPVRGDDRES